MKKETADLICAALDESGAEYTRHDDYSGRSMYGKTTVGIVVDSLGAFTTAAVRAAFVMGQDVVSVRERGTSAERETLPDPEEFARDVARVRTDNMGRSDIIVY